jgi:glycosyltransferase involved in cell wall biosynthesis
MTGMEITVSLQAVNGMRRVLEDFRPDLVNAHHQYFTTTPSALVAARQIGIPTVLTLHIAAPESFRGWRGTVARMYGSTVGKGLVASADAVVAVSEAVARSVTKRSGQILRVIPNGVDIERFHPNPSREPGLRIVFVGRFIANKGPDVAIEAFDMVQERVTGATMVMVGDGPMADSLRRQVDEHGLGEAVTFLGLQDDVSGILRQSDIFVRPSEVEGMPLTILEAMATGLPVVACDVGGVSEVVSAGLTGHVVPPGSAREVAGALLDILTDKGKAAAMGAAGLSRAREGFSWEATTAANLDLFQELTRGRLG